MLEDANSRSLFQLFVYNILFPMRKVCSQIKQVLPVALATELIQRQQAAAAGLKNNFTFCEIHVVVGSFSFDYCLFIC